MPFRITRKGSLQGNTVRGKTTILAPAGKSLDPAVLPIKARLSHDTTGTLVGPGAQINRPLPTAVDYLVIGGGGGGAGYYDTTGSNFAGGGGGAGEVKSASNYSITQSVAITVTVGTGGTGGTAGAGGTGTSSIFSAIVASGGTGGDGSGNGGASGNSFAGGNYASGDFTGYGGG